MTTRPVRATFVVPDLAAGGAERNLVSVLGGADPARLQGRVVCLGEPGALYDEAAALAPARALRHAKRQVLRSVWTLARELRRTRADVVVCRGYSAETVGRLAAVLARVPHRVVWVHNCSDTEPRGRVRTVVDAALEPATDVYLGVARAQVAYLTGELRHPARKVRIVHNGVDVEAFGRPEHAAAGRAVRTGLGLGPDDLVVTILAALRPEKDHELFLRAAQQVAGRVSAARFLVVGDGARRADLERLAVELGLGDRVVFAGHRTDVPQVLAASDVVVLSSWTVECFPVSLLEAMASRVPAVATDVGGVAEIVVEGVTGHVVPSRRPEPLARRVAELLADPARRRAYGAAARTRVEEHFTLARNVTDLEHTLAAVVGLPDGSPGPPAPARPVGLTAVMDTTAVGGAEIVTLRAFGAMDRSRVTPSLVCLREEGPLAGDFRAAGVGVRALGRSGRFDVRTLPRLVRALRASGTDAVLLAHHHRASLVLGRIAARLAGVRVVLVAAHDMDLVPLGGRVLPPSTVATLRGVSALVLLAPSQGDYLHRHEGVGARPWSRTREVVVPNGIPLAPPPTAADRAAARAALGLPDDAFVVGIVARLSAQKAHHVLLEAFVAVRAAVPRARLVVVGGGERDAELRALAVRLGIGDAVLFAGVRRDVGALLPGFDVACLSSVHEAAPLTVLEAMAAGVPVVATRCGALADLVEDGREGVLVDVGDTGALAAALVGLSADEDRRLATGRAARVRAEHDFAVERTARGYEDLVVGLLARRGGRGTEEDR
ncbi:hypothetical protein GCM10009737_22100 [Nocardioides lentus]|uniref:Glycosyltransferase n=1 Tax=Nocardioides lentus TaxID=338077 RepID=A0ABN2PF77_9ACTN